eukprot:530409-Prorocentrum_minimum.AAC.1
MESKHRVSSAFRNMLLEWPSLPLMIRPARGEEGVRRGSGGEHVAGVAELAFDDEACKGVRRGSGGGVEGVYRSSLDA